MTGSDNLAKTVLLLAANPQNTSRLRLDEEVREIHAGLQRSRKRDNIILKQQWAIRSRDVYRALLDFRPQIVHFCGHGTKNGGLALEDEAGKIQLVNAEALASLFQLFSDRVECVLLNACYSETQAQAIARHVDYAIGMNQKIGDKAAISFVVGFYDAVGAGESFDFAYQLGCRAIQMAGIPEQLTPIIKKNDEPNRRTVRTTYRQYLSESRPNELGTATSNESAADCTSATTRIKTSRPKLSPILSRSSE